MRYLLFYILSVLFTLHSVAAVYTYNSNGMSFAWVYDDHIAVYPSEGTVPIQHWATTVDADKHYSAFSGYGWTVAGNTSYTAYSPYNNTYLINGISPSALPVSYLNQAQLYNGSTAHLSACDFMMSKFTTGTSSADITFAHCGSIIRIEWAMAEANTFTSLSLSTEENLFVTQATMNLPAQTFNATTKAKSLSLSLDNINVSAGDALVAYLMVAPANLKDKTVTLTLNAADGTELTASLPGTNILAGKTYPISVSKENTSVSAPRSSANSSILTSGPSSSLAAPVAYAPGFPIDRANTFSFDSDVLKGDVNGDGTVDIVDAVALNGYYLSGKTATLNPAVCDVNNDGSIDVVDVVAITSKYLTGK